MGDMFPLTWMGDREDMKTVRYAYALTGALLLGGTAASLTFQNPATAQTAQND